MHVILINNRTIAVVDSLAHMDTNTYEEIDAKDSKKLIRGNPELQAQVQRIFVDVMRAMGFVPSSPEPQDTIN